MSSSPMLQRAIGSAVVVPVGLLLTLWPFGTLGVAAMLIALSALEAERLFGAILGGASGRWAAALLLSPVFGTILGGVPLGAVLAVGTFTLFLAWELRLALQSDAEHLAPRARALIGTVAVAAWLSPLILLLLLGAGDGGAPSLWLLWLLAVVWSADTFALLVGRSIGRRRLAPVLSPRKSVEGLVGGLLAATAIGGAFGVLAIGMPLALAVAGSLATAAAAEGGDLLESLIKRAAGAERSSSLIPGHGGVLDRIDSLIVATPVAMLVALLALLPD